MSLKLIKSTQRKWNICNILGNLVSCPTRFVRNFLNVAMNDMSIVDYGDLIRFPSENLQMFLMVGFRFYLRYNTGPYLLCLINSMFNGDRASRQKNLE